MAGEEKGGGEEEKGKEGDEVTEVDGAGGKGKKDEGDKEPEPEKPGERVKFKQGGEKDDGGEKNGDDFEVIAKQVSPETPGEAENFGESERVARGKVKSRPKLGLDQKREENNKTGNEQEEIKILIQGIPAADEGIESENNKTGEYKDEGGRFDEET